MGNAEQEKQPERKKPNRYLVSITINDLICVNPSKADLIDAFARALDTQSAGTFPHAIKMHTEQGVLTFQLLKLGYPPMEMDPAGLDFKAIAFWPGGTKRLVEGFYQAHARQGHFFYYDD